MIQQDYCNKRGGGGRIFLFSDFDYQTGTSEILKVAAEHKFYLESSHLQLYPFASDTLFPLQVGMSSIFFH